MLILGSKGVLGREVCCAANNMGYDTYWPDKYCVDVTDYYELHQCIARFRPEIVINCAGLVKSRQESDDRFLLVNGVVPHWMANECDIVGARLIQISTDCVFSGTRYNGKYSEDDIPDPIDIYGISKRAGEITRKPHLTIRTSFIGFGERGLLAWLLAQKGVVPGYVNTYWNGLTATTLARVIMSLANDNLYGMLHVHSKDVISKYTLLTMLAIYLNLDIEVHSEYDPKVEFCNRSLKTIRNYPSIDTIPSMSSMLEEMGLIKQLIEMK